MKSNPNKKFASTAMPATVDTEANTFLVLTATASISTTTSQVAIFPASMTDKSSAEAAKSIAATADKTVAPY